MKWKTPSFLRPIGAWVTKHRAGVQRDLWTEIKKRAYTVIVTLLFAAIILVLGGPKIANWYKQQEEKQLNPPRTVYFQGRVCEMYNTRQRIEEVDIKIKGIEGVQATTDENGYFIFPKEETTKGEIYEFILVKPGYETDHYFEITVPDEHKSDTTIIHQWQIRKIVAKPVNNVQSTEL